MAQRDIKKIDKVVLDNFYKLVHTQPNVRLTAAASTYKILAALKKRKQDSFNEHLNYCIDRLVSGLASSRALARQGYGTLLMELLKNYQVSTERLFSIAQQKFGNISNETTRDNLLGYFLLISIVLESGNYKKAKSNSNYLEKIYKYLIQLKNIKSYFDYPVSKLLVDYYELFHPHLLADVPPHAIGSDAKLSQTEFLVVTLCNKKEPLRNFLNLDTNEFTNLCTTLLDERLHRRPLHPVWAEIGKLIMHHLPQHFELFCTKFLFPVFFKPNHNELAAIGLELISHLLKAATETNSIKVLLSDYLIRLLILSLRNKGSLTCHCQQFFKSLSISFGEALKSDKQDIDQICNRHYFILTRLTSAPGSVAFDEDSKSSSIVNLLNNSHSSVLKRYLEKLIALLSTKSNSDESKKIHNVCAKQIAHIIRRPQMTEEFITAQRLSKFLLVSCLFQPCPKNNNEDGEFWTETKIPRPIAIHESVRAMLRSSYHATLDHIVSSSLVTQRVESMNELIEFSNKLLKLKSYEFVDDELQEKVPELWTQYMASLTKHRKFLMKHKEPKQLLPITCLYLFYGMQIIEHGLECKVQLEELSQSSNEAYKGDPNDGSWADVLTDQIIAILSATECNPWIRKLCVSVFGSLLPHISETSIDLLCDVIRAPLDDGCDDDEESMDEDDMQNSDGDVDQDMQASGDEANDSDVEDSNESDSDDDESSCDEELNDEDSIDEGAKMHDETISANEDQEDDDEEYLDDEQMMKMDSVLADMFKLNRVGKKKRRDPSFKLRCLDLVKKVVLKRHNDTELMNKILRTIVPLATKSRKSVETRPIASKIDTMIAKMPGKSKLNMSGANVCDKQQEQQLLAAA